jgi:hydrogenase maturation protease
MRDTFPEAESRSGVLIAGIGNANRGDDAAGLLVAQRLLALGIPAIAWEGLPLDLIPRWESLSRVVLVDAVQGDSPVGTLHHWDASRVPLPPEPFCASTHGFGLAEAVELSRATETLPSQVEVYGIEAAQFQHGAPMSVEVAASVATLTALLANRFGGAAVR